MTSQDFLDIKNFISNKEKLLELSPTRTFLALDSSTQMASVALSLNGSIIYSEECIRQKSHSEWINGAIERAIVNLPGGWSCLELICLTHGPGSFTGLRVATNVAKTIAYSYNIPLVSISSLEVLAYQVELTEDIKLSMSESVFKNSHNEDTTFENSDVVILPLINAFKNMVFYGMYYKSKDEFKTLMQPQVIGIEELNGFLKLNKKNIKKNAIVIVGDGVNFYQTSLNLISEPKLIRPNSPQDFPLASTLVKMINSNWTGISFKLIHWSELMPLYLRASAAEEAIAGR